LFLEVSVKVTVPPGLRLPTLCTFAEKVNPELAGTALPATLVAATAALGVVEKS
jgi:hypothetical protein